MNEIIAEAIAIFSLILANGIFSMSEMAIVTARKTRLQTMAEEGSKGAKIALELAEDPNNFLSTIQVGITLIGVLAGALSGATIATVLTEFFVHQLGEYAHYAATLAFAVVVVTVTYVSLVVGELVPKQIALSYRESIAVVMARPMKLFAAFIRPLAWILTLSSTVFLKVLGIKNNEEPSITEDEIRTIINEGTKAGVVEASEQSMVENVFNLDDLPVAQLMTHRPDVIWLSVNDSLENNFQKIMESGHSYFPVCGDSLDDVLGITSVKFLLPDIIRGELKDLTKNLIEPLFVPENMAGAKLLETFKQSRKHIALVIDEYGSVQGIATLKDVLEAIVGDLPTNDSVSETQAVLRDDGSWLIDGMMPLEDFEELFHIDLAPENESVSYNTVAGFIMSELERLPVAGEKVEYRNFVFEIMDMDGRRIDKLLVKPPAPESLDATD